MKYISCILALIMVISSVTINIYAVYSDIPANASYANAANRMAALGIIDGIENSNYKPNNKLSREQFIKIAVTAAGLSKNAEKMMGKTAFTDIDPKSWSSGYVNLALNKGFIKKTADNKFYPYKDITYVEACTIAVQVLGYTDKEIKVAISDNFIKKAKDLGLTKGINLGSRDKLPKWAAALLIDKLWINKVKSGDFKDLDQIFYGNPELYTECMIMGDSKTTSSLTSNQVLTDKGIFYISASVKKLELGETYRAITDEDTIIKVSDKIYNVLPISVDIAIDTNITYKDGDTEQTMTLPNKTDYYYQGIKQNYDSLKNILHKNTSIIFTYNENKTGFNYAVIIDPIYSKPQLAQNFSPSDKQLGTIEFTDNTNIIKNGEAIDILQILSGDIVYQVSDIWNKNKYILVTDTKVGGKITAILPNKLSPKSIQIDSVNYDLSRDIDLNKIVNGVASLKVDDNIIVSLDSDGKIVYIHYPGGEDTSNYAFVVNVSYNISREDSGLIKTSYYAKLLLDSGIITTYKVTSDPAQLKGKIVKYKSSDTQTISLEQLIYNFPEESYINKGNRQLGKSDVTDNLKIFDVVSDDGGDAQVRLLNWNDLPDGTISNGKLLYSNTVSSFGDINILLTNDILGEKFKSAVVQKINVVGGGRGTSSYQYTLLVDGKVYQYNDYIPNAYVGSVEKVRMSGTGIDMILNEGRADVSGTEIQAINGKKMMVKNKVYKFKSNLTVYYKDFMNNLSVKTLGDIIINHSYSSISIYFDKNNDEKAEVIVLSE